MECRDRAYMIDEARTMVHKIETMLYMKIGTGLHEDKDRGLILEV